MRLLSTLVTGEADLADVLLLAAFIVFVVGTVLAVMESARVLVCVSAGLALAALAWLVL